MQNDEQWRADTDTPFIIHHSPFVGVGYLLYALLQLDGTLADPQAVASGKSIMLGKGKDRVRLAVDNW